MNACEDCVNAYFIDDLTLCGLCIDAPVEACLFRQVGEMVEINEFGLWYLSWLQSV
jgi:hypothetical protein